MVASSSARTGFQMNICRINLLIKRKDSNGIIVERERERERKREIEAN